MVLFDEIGIVCVKGFVNMCEYLESLFEVKECGVVLL